MSGRENLLPHFLEVIMDNEKKIRSVDDIIYERKMKFCPVIQKNCIGRECHGLYVHEWGSDITPTVACKIIDGLGAIFSTSCGQEL